MFPKLYVLLYATHLSAAQGRRPGYEHQLIESNTTVTETTPAPAPETP
ncbi:hypothetical protein ACJBCE_36430 [Streptomyces sp. NBUL23]